MMMTTMYNWFPRKLHQDQGNCVGGLKVAVKQYLKLCLADQDRRRTVKDLNRRNQNRVVTTAKSRRRNSAAAPEVEVTVNIVVARMQGAATVVKDLGPGQGKVQKEVVMAMTDLLVYIILLSTTNKRLYFHINNFFVFVFII